MTAGPVPLAPLVPLYLEMVAVYPGGGDAVDRQAFCESGIDPRPTASYVPGIGGSIVLNAHTPICGKPDCGHQAAGLVSLTCWLNKIVHI